MRVKVRLSLCDVTSLISTHADGVQNTYIGHLRSSNHGSANEQARAHVRGPCACTIIPLDKMEESRVALLELLARRGHQHITSSSRSNLQPLARTPASASALPEPQPHRSLTLSPTLRLTLRLTLTSTNSPTHSPLTHSLSHSLTYLPLGVAAHAGSLDRRPSLLW